MKRTHFVLSAALWVLGLLAYAKTEPKSSYSQLAQDIFLSGKDSLIYKNIHFLNDLPENGAETFTSTYTNGGAPETIYGGFLNYLKTKGAQKDKEGKYRAKSKIIQFVNCTFDNDIRFSNVHFEGAVFFENCNFPTVSEDFVGLYGQKFGGAILVDSCVVQDFQVLFRENTDYRFFLKFNHTKLNNLFFIELQKSTSQILNSDFSTGNTYIQLHKESEFQVEDCKFGEIFWDLDHIYSTHIIGCSFTGRKEKFNVLNLFSDYATLFRNQFNSNAAIQFEKGFVFLDSNSFSNALAFDFNGIDKTSYLNLASLNNLDFGIIQGNAFYNAKSKDQLLNDVGYKTLLRIHKGLYDFYKLIGDSESANQVYVKIREIEHRKLSVDYTSAPSFKTFFDFNLNRLLKFYTNYGTDPANALVVSFYIILFFGFIYFFFPSDWDISSKSELIKNFRDFAVKNEKGYFFPFLKMMFGLLLSVTNATALSLNAFTTLGFGNIPTRGFARYICIIQGFIGWFLLSIFTVALINQAQF